VANGRRPERGRDRLLLASARGHASLHSRYADADVSLNVEDDLGRIVVVVVVVVVASGRSVRREEKLTRRGAHRLSRRGSV